MNSFLGILLIAGLGFLPGCASQPAAVAPAGPSGALLVFSAYSVRAPFNSTDPERRKHSDYKVLSPEGKLLFTVRNDNGKFVEGPALLSLAPGAYLVKARAPGYGWVDVPVEIQAGRATEIHLEAPDRAQHQAASVKLVRLPAGAPVGWQLNSPK